MIRRRWALYCAIIGGFQLLVQNRLFPSFSCHFFFNALQKLLFTVEYYKFALKISQKQKNFIFPTRFWYAFNSFTLPISIYFIQKADKLNIFANLIQTIFLDIAIFIATDLTSYAKMISLWVFFVFVVTFCIGFTRTEKY